MLNNTIKQYFLSIKKYVGKIPLSLCNKIKGIKINNLKINQPQKQHILLTNDALRIIIPVTIN